MVGDFDDAVRAAAFASLAEMALQRGETMPAVLPSSVIREGFSFQGKRMHFMFFGRGMFKPSGLRIPLSFNSKPPDLRNPAPYNDRIEDDGTLIYCYQGDNPNDADNAGLRDAMLEHKPLAYFAGITKGLYEVWWPVFVIGDSRRELEFKVDLRGSVVAASEGFSVQEEPARSYSLGTVLRRQHQRRFSERVIFAYGHQCAVCRLRHLLDGAHIIADGKRRGDPIVPNGLSLCKLHHAAFDRNIIGIRPDRRVVVRQDVRDEVDGPMLLHGLQQTHNTPIHAPRAPGLAPAPDRLEERYEEFMRAS